MASVLTIAGTTINRVVAHAVLTRLHLSLDEYSEVEFSEIGATLPGQWHPGQAVTLAVDGTPAFLGQITGRHPHFAESGWTISYHCLGLKYLGNLIPFTNANDLTGLAVYNLPSDDPDYVSSNSGLSIGTILQRTLDGHAAALAAVGIAGYVAADLTPLTVVPPEPVTLQGSRLFNVLDGLIDQWSGIYALSVEWNPPTSDWRVRVRNTTTFTPTTLTIGSDPIEPPEVSRDTTDCFSRVVIRGRGDIAPWYGSLSAGTLAKAWSSADEAAWTWADFSQPAGAIDAGTITALSSTQATVRSGDATKTWGVNYWSGVNGWSHLINAAVTGLTQQESRRIISNTALTAGGTSILTFDRALDQAGYTTYRIVGQPSNTRVDVYRRFNILNDQVKAHLARKFPGSQPWGNATLTIQVNYPVAEIDAAGAGYPWPFEIDQVAGQIRFIEPVVKAFNTQANLDAGGASVTQVSDVKVLLAYSRGTLTAVAPPDVGGVPQYQGTSYTQDGIARTWTLDVPTWLDARDATRMAGLAQMDLDTVKDSVLTFQCVYAGKWSPGLVFGKALNFAGNGYTTGLEAINVPVREVTLEYPAAGGTNWITRLGCSNRRKAGTGEALFLPVPWGQARLDAAGGGYGYGGGGLNGFGYGGGGPLDLSMGGAMPAGSVGGPDEGVDYGGASGPGFDPATAGWVGGAEQATGNWVGGAEQTADTWVAPANGQSSDEESEG